MELDLHGMTVAEAMAAFRATYNRLAAHHRGARLTVVHGYSTTGDAERTIKAELHRLLRRQSERLKFVPGEEADGNPGHTHVEVGAPLPVAGSELGEAIVVYCEGGKTREKVLRKFMRRGGEQVVTAAIDQLLRAGQLRVGTKGKVRVLEPN
jgi:Smr domain